MIKICLEYEVGTVFFQLGGQSVMQCSTAYMFCFHILFHLSQHVAVVVFKKRDTCFTSQSNCKCNRRKESSQGTVNAETACFALSVSPQAGAKGQSERGCVLTEGSEKPTYLERSCRSQEGQSSGLYWEWARAPAPWPKPNPFGPKFFA